MELSLTKLFGGSRYLIQLIHAKKLQVRIFSRLCLKIQDNALTISVARMKKQDAIKYVHGNRHHGRVGCA